MPMMLHFSRGSCLVRAKSPRVSTKALFASLSLRQVPQQYIEPSFAYATKFVLVGGDGEGSGGGKPQYLSTRLTNSVQLQLAAVFHVLNRICVVA